MRIIKAIAVLIPLGLSLSGCATLDKTECLSADWEKLGYSDARDGRRVSRLEKHADACSEYGVTPDSARYRAGYDQGVLVYCTADNGFIQGRQGRRYRDICPIDLEPNFLASYQRGELIYLAEREIEELQRELRKKRDHLERTWHLIDHKENRLHSEKLSRDERQHLEDDIDKLSRRIHRLRWDIQDIRFNLMSAEDRFRRLDWRYSE